MFNPTAATRHILAATALTDPADIAAEVYKLTPECDIADLYHAMLQVSVREIIRFENMQARNPTPAPAPAKPNRSSKVAAIRQAHIAYWDQRVNVDGTWKLLGDCSVTDLRTLAETRRVVAERNNAMAEEYERLIDRMEHAGVATARELEAVAA